MKLALITDIHANREAFEACLEQSHLHGAERIALLGDFVGYGADPGWVVDRVQDLVFQGAIAVRGNHDEAVAQAASLHLVEDARRVIDWTRERLRPDQIAFLASLPMQRQEAGCLFVHANAYAPAAWEYVLGRIEAVRSLHATDCRHTFCGHVHAPGLYHLSSTGKIADFSPTAGVAVPVPAHRQWLGLPGSAGQPRDGNPAAWQGLERRVFDFLTVKTAKGELSQPITLIAINEEAMAALKQRLPWPRSRYADMINR
ncbi:MAG: metallophosphoesterase family protein, partial [Burkholderiales bacterium]